MPRYHVIFNARSGTTLSQGIDVGWLEKRLRDAGLEAMIDADRQLSMDERLERAARSDADVIIAAGGDGTVTGVANAIVGTDKSLAVLPLGTVNLLARDLAIPLDLEAWMAALPAMTPRRIDVGEVNGKVFLHKVVAGIFPGITAGREQIRERKGLSAKIGFIVFFFRRLVRTRRMSVEIAEPDRPTRALRVAAVAIANNQYDEGPGRFFSRQRLDRGHLTVYIVTHLGVDDLFRLVAKMILGRWRRDEALQIETTPALRLRSRKRKLHVMVDGEVASLATPLDFRIRPLALSVLAPPMVEADANEPAGADTVEVPPRRKAG